MHFSGQRKFSILVACTGLLAGSLCQAISNAEIASQLTAAQKRQLDVIQGLSIAGLSEVEAATRAEVLRQQTEVIWQMGLPAIGSRQLDAQGRAPVHHWIEQRIEQLAPQGVEFLGSLRGRTAAPVSLDRLANAEQRGSAAVLQTDSGDVPVFPLWPNGPMPSLAPEEGLSGPVFYVRRGEWPDLDGLPLDGAIAVMDFSGGRRLERLFSLGVQAVIVLQDDFVQYESARLLFSSTPLPFPRFYLPRDQAAGVLAQAAQNRERIATGAPYTTVSVFGGNVYEMRPVESLFAYLPPSDPVRVPIQAATLLDLIASDYGLSADDLMRANQLDSPALQPGQVLLLPGGRGSYTVRADELLGRLSTLYGTSLQEIRRVNNLSAGQQPTVGTELVLPKLPTPLVITVDMDAASVVPDVAHGARTVANLASALQLMEHMATSRHLNRRRGVLFAFMDGNTLGGVGTRLLAEYLFLQENEFATTGGSRGISDAEILDYYERSHIWFTEGRAPENVAVARWLADEWLMGHLEDARIYLAEQRIPLILQLNRTGDAAEAARLRAQLAEIEAELRKVVDVRLESLALRAPPAERLNALRAILTDPVRVADLAPYGLAPEALALQFEREMAEERMIRSNNQNNMEVGARILATLRGAQTGGLRLGIQLDLLDGSHHLGVGDGSNGLLGGLRAAALQRQMAPRLRLAAAHAAELSGWQEPMTFTSVEDSANLAVVPTRPTPVYDSFWRFGDVVLLPIGGRNDMTPFLDSPADTLASINFANLSVQARTAFTLIRLFVESPSDSTVNINFPMPELSVLTGRTVQFNIRSGIDARDPVPGTYVYLPLVPNDPAFDSENAMAYFGYRRSTLAISRLNGSFRMPVELTTFHRRPQVMAYQLDRSEALFRKVMTQGQVGTSPQSNVFQYRRGSELERNLVMIDTYPKVIFPGADPSEYIPMGGSPRAPAQVELMDAVREGAPRDFAVDNPMLNFRERDLDGIVLNLPEGIRVRAMVRRGLDFRMLLVGEVDMNAPRARGAGHLVGPLDDGDRNLYLALTPYHIARQMTDLARHRLDVYQRFGISSRSLEAAVARAQDKLAEAEAAKAEGQWRDTIGASREAWGILVKNYPRILGLGREAVFSVIILMAFLVPSAWFLQSLFSGAKGIIAQLAWTTAIFTLGTLFLNYFHPAFRIALSPFIVVIAFTMILMSTIVIGLSYQRFEVLLRRFRSESGEVESEEISLFSSLGTAFSLGISNLRKRMFRTVLTVVTVTALTFSIIAFVAISGRDTVFRVAVPLDTFVDGDHVEPLEPVYNGMLLRNFQWQEFPQSRIVALETEFGGRMDLTVRAFFLEVEGGNNAAREGVNQIPVLWQQSDHVLTGIMVFQPNEVDFSGLHRAVSHNEWFRGEQFIDGAWQPAERFSVILPDVAAAALGIGVEHIFDAAGERLPHDQLPLVRMQNNDWRVIGILDTEKANRIRDINGRSLAMVDFLRSGMSPAVSGQLEQEGDSFHMNWSRLAIVPYAARNDVGAKLRSVALRFGDDLDQEEFFNDIALRFKQPFFAASEGEVSFVVPRQRVDMGGLAKVILPVVLCILIVMNTMLGTVEERKGEVGMLGAIGLSPRQISFLMFSESTVFSILGIILGTFGGLLFSNIVQGLNARDIAFLSGLSFNFTSILSMLLATATGLVVLMATLIPARKAAAMAAPSGMSAWELPAPDDNSCIQFTLPFTLTRGNAVGMVAFFRGFLLNHTESTSEDFNCREVRLKQIREEAAPALFLETAMWLMPYDLDVAQHFRMKLHPGATEGVFIVDLELQRFSGSEENWLRTAYNFLNLVRQQFLLWRNLAPEARTRYIEAGALLLSEQATSLETAKS